jgi:hypothetical protein
MKKQPTKIALARETLRRLDPAAALEQVGGGTFPNTMLPNHCHTASCHGICFAPEPPVAAEPRRAPRKARKP